MDLRRFAPGRTRSVSKALGRSERYLERVRPDTLKMDDLFAIGRVLGFGSAEFLEHLGKFSRQGVIPSGPVGLWAKVAALDSDPKLTGLAEVLAWGYGIVSDEEADGLSMDLRHRLETFEVALGRADMLAYAELTLSLFARNSPQILDPKSIRGLIGSLLTVIELLNAGRPRGAGSAAALLDLGFYLESLMDDLALRHQLFAAGGEIGAASGLPLLGVWSLKEATRLALVIGDYEQAELYEIAGDRIPIKYARKAAQISEPLTEASRETLGALLEVMVIDRKLGGISAEDLDKRLGASKAFISAYRGRGSLSLERWCSFLKAVGVSPESQLRRLSLTCPASPPSLSALLPRLKLNGSQEIYKWWNEGYGSLFASLSVDEDRASRAELREPFGSVQRPEAVTEALAVLDTWKIHSNPTVNHEDCRRLCEFLFCLTRMLRSESRFNEALDVFDAIFHLKNRLPLDQKHAYAYRNLGTLAMEVGNLPLAKVFLERAISLDLSLWNPSGLVHSYFTLGDLADVQGDYFEAIQLFSGCLQADAYRSFGPEFVHLSLARTYLNQGELSFASRSIASASSALNKGLYFETNVLWVEAEILSLRGEGLRAVELLDQAEKTFAAIGNITDLVLIGVEKCRNYLRLGQLAKAREQAKGLIATATRLERNPLGRAAVLDLARGIFSSEISLAAVQEIILQIRWPNLAGKSGQD